MIGRSVMSLWPPLSPCSLSLSLSLSLSDLNFFKVPELSIRSTCLLFDLALATIHNKNTTQGSLLSNVEGGRKAQSFTRCHWNFFFSFLALSFIRFSCQSHDGKKSREKTSPASPFLSRRTRWVPLAPMPLQPPATARATIEMWVRVQCVCFVLLHEQTTTVLWSIYWKSLEVRGSQPSVAHVRTQASTHLPHNAVKSCLNLVNP